MAGQPTYRLSQLCASIRNAIETATRRRPFWVECEIARLSQHGPHRYLELVETEGDQVLAKMKGVLFGGSWDKLERRYGDELTAVVATGNNVLLQVFVNFKAEYGLELGINDVNLEYTYGDVELRKQRTRERLDELGLLEKNGLVPVPRVVQRIAVVGSPGTAGMADFIEHIDENPYGFRFLQKEFATSVQGPSAASQIVAALREADTYDFDAVVLIRGGGGTMDLDVFNAFEVCQTIANMRLPVFTGIGHETDTTLADELANSNLKTPTAAADHIIVRAADFSARIKNTAKQVALRATQNLASRRDQLATTSSGIARATETVTGVKRHRVVTTKERIAGCAKTLIDRHLERLRSHRANLAIRVDGRLSQREPIRLDELHRRLVAAWGLGLANQDRVLRDARRRLDILKPLNTLHRGYSITRDADRALLLRRDQVKVGDLIRTDLATFTIFSEVNRIHDHGTHDGIAKPEFRIGADIRKGDERARGNPRRIGERPGPDRRVGGEG